MAVADKARNRRTSRVAAVCVACARGARRITRDYRDLLLGPQAMFTLASALLLIAAIVAQPSGVISSGDEGAERHILYLLSALLGSSFIWWSAIQGIRQRDFTADIPVSVATIAAIAIGQYSAAAVVAVLLLIGGLLEEIVAARAGNALESLARLLPAEVTVRRGGKDIVMPLDEVVVDDIVLVRAAERIPVDGVVVSGAAAVDQAAITGESMPVDKEPGDQVFAGTLNGVGWLEVRATKVGEDTTLGAIRRMVAEAQSQKAPIERLLDRYAKFYTPVALALAALLWAWSGDALQAITMLIVFCPCVMVLATPTALVASIGNAALRGSLVKRGATIEAMSSVDTVVFDKTGTVTLGRPALVEVESLDGSSKDDLLAHAAAAERFSEHVLGRAVVDAAVKRGLDLRDPNEFEALPGHGVRAVLDGHEVILGRPGLLDERGIAGTDEAKSRIDDLIGDGRTPVWMARDGRVAGILVFEDEVRPEAAPTVERLHALGIRTLLVTGDQRAAAERMGRRLNIDEVHAEVLPQGKVEIIKELQAAGRKVAFVGDGVNDGPALATANIGVAMGVIGTDVAIETADIALLSDQLSRVPHLLNLSQKAIKAIRQNVVFSVAILIGAVVLTFAGILTPVSGALLHELSSIPVIANSARLIGHRDRFGGDYSEATVPLPVMEAADRTDPDPARELTTTR